jgi:diguanylate cyclase (GGDEF)-like protein
MTETGDGARPTPTPTPTDDRDRTAEDRDLTSAAQDETAEARDRRSAARDARAETRDRARPVPDWYAASDRAGARRDRQGSAGDRQHSEHDRQAAAADRASSASERASLLLDGLTGAHRRDPGLLELEREVLKAHRTGTSFVLAFLDVDGLKHLNDSQGHAAGDQLLADVITTVRDQIREYDVVVRYGGDEFLIGLPELGLVEAERRFDDANASLGTRRAAHVTVGLVALAPEETLADLIARADAEMYAHRTPRAEG